MNRALLTGKIEFIERVDEHGVSWNVLPHWILQIGTKKYTIDEILEQFEGKNIELSIREI